MNRRYISIGIIPLLILSVIAGATAGMLNLMKVYIASEIGGVVTMKGKPVAGVNVVRITKTPSKIFTNKMVTDAKGRFHFKAVTQYSLMKKYVEQAITDEEMYFYYDGKKYLGWEHLKMNYEKNGEADDHRSLTGLKCKLDEKPVKNDQNIRNPITGVCV